MIGIYKFTNKLNGLSYIGQSINIEKRIKQHKNNSLNKNAGDYNSKFHKALREFGFNKFTIEILTVFSPDEYSQDFLNELEKYYIKIYDTYQNGYNSTSGGKGIIGNNAQPGEKNGRALLKESDVYYIRECYNAHIPFRIVYSQYKDIISKCGLQKVWWFENWKNILPEYNTEENKFFHTHQAKANSKEIASQNKRKFSSEQIKEMRQRYDLGENPKSIQKDFGPDMAYSTIYNIVTRKTYKNVN